MMMELTYLLNGYNQRCHGYSGKQLVDADWRVHYSKMMLAESCWFTANELRFAGYCDFHACWKRERKSDYQKRYRTHPYRPGNDRVIWH